MDLLERFELFEISPRCAGDFNQKLEEFYKKIAALPQREVIVVEAKGRRTRL
jgi:hypothetical protein